MHQRQRISKSNFEIFFYFQPSLLDQHRRHPEGQARRVRRQHNGGTAQARGDQHHGDPDPSGIQQLYPRSRHRPAQAGEAGQEETGNLEGEQSVFHLIGHGAL